MLQFSLKNWSFLQKVVLWRRLMLQFSVYDFEILSKHRIGSIQYWQDSVIIWQIPQGLSLKHCWKIQQHSWEVRREANSFKRSKKKKTFKLKSNEVFNSWGCAYLNEMTNTRKLIYGFIFCKSNFHFMLLYDSVTTYRWWIFLDLTKRLTICLWQVSETSLWQRLWTSSLQLIHL